jgi:hypothetical protein
LGRRRLGEIDVGVERVFERQFRSIAGATDCRFLLGNG